MLKIIPLAALLVLATSVFDIMHFGAIPHSDTVPDQQTNARAILAAIKAANASEGDRVVVIPNKKFFSYPIRVQYAHNITISIYGKLIASKNVAHWPRQPNSQYYEDFISFRHSTYIEMEGGGKIDGRGYHWWILTLLEPNKYLTNQNFRPHLIHMIDTNFTKIHDMVWKNAAQFHFKLDQCHDGEIYNIDIKVNTTAQINLIKKFSIQGVVPMFPLNTDGIDPAGARFHIYNITCQNYDDVVVPKPEAQADCTRDFLVQNCTVRLGVGMTIGSVPPKLGCNCIQNVTFRNVQMVRPLKGIYIKSNPGDQGTGLIKDILYQNITMDRPVWWAIYIGPQQMKEPDGDGPGCMLYPLGTCQTQPRVTMANITLQDIKIHKSLLYPYTIRCNVSNPCKDINFYNVQTDKWLIGMKQTGYVCEYAMGKRRDNYPPIHCLDNIGQSNLQMEVPKPTFMESMWQRGINGVKLGRMLMEELERAALEVGYQEEDDDFSYDLAGTGIEDISLDFLQR